MSPSFPRFLFFFLEGEEGGNIGRVRASSRAGQAVYSPSITLDGAIKLESTEEKSIARIVERKSTSGVTTSLS